MREHMVCALERALRGCACYTASPQLYGAQGSGPGGWVYRLQPGRAPMHAYV